MTDNIVYSGDREVPAWVRVAIRSVVLQLPLFLPREVRWMASAKAPKGNVDGIICLATCEPAALWRRITLYHESLDDVDEVCTSVAHELAHLQFAGHGLWHTVWTARLCLLLRGRTRTGFLSRLWTRVLLRLLVTVEAGR